MAIKIADKFVKASNNEAVKLMDAKDVAYDSSASVNKVVDNPDNVQDAIYKLNSYINAEPLFAIVPSGNKTIVGNTYTINSDQSNNVVIDIINSSIIGNTSEITIKNNTTGSSTKYQISNKAINTISLGSFNNSGTYNFTISGNDAIQNPFTLGIYEYDAETKKYVIRKLDTTYNTIVIEVIIGKLQLNNNVFNYNSESTDYKSNMLVVSNDLNDKILNSIDVLTTVSYPNITSGTRQVSQKVSYTITTKNVYYKTTELIDNVVEDVYKSVYDNLSELSKIPDEIYIKHEYMGNEVYKRIYDYSELEETYKESFDDITLIDSESINIYDQKDGETSATNHDSINDNIKFTIPNQYFIYELPHNLNITCSIYEGDNDSYMEVATTTNTISLHPIKLETIHNNNYTDISTNIINTSPTNISNILSNEQFILNLVATSSITGNIKMNYNLYKVNDNDEIDIKKGSQTIGISQNKRQSTYSINLGVLTSGLYRLIISYTVLANPEISCGDNFEILFPIRHIESTNKYKTDGLVAYWDATNHLNTQEDADIWYAKDYTGDEKHQYYFKLSGLNLVNNSNNGWMTESKLSSNNEFKLNKSFIRFTGNSYGKAYRIVNGDSKEFKLSDIILNECVTHDGMTFEIVYRTKNIGVMDACVVSARVEESITDKSFSFNDSDRYESNPGITISHNKAIISTEKDRIKTQILENEWKHVTLVFDQQESKFIKGQENIQNSAYNPTPSIRIYVNGVLTAIKDIDSTVIDENTQENVIFRNSEQVILNGHNDGTGNVTGFGNCDISLIRIYDNALNSGEVFVNYKSTILNDIELDAINNNNANMPAIYLAKNRYAGSTARKSKVSDPINNTTFKSLFNITQKEDSKKYCVNCTMKYYDPNNDDLVMNNVDVYLQGTSTLKFPIKNLKLRAYKNIYDIDGETLVKGGGNSGDDITKKLKFTPNMDTWIPDYCYTLKADYMESAHLNNTPTGMFYDKVVDAVNIADKSNGGAHTTSIESNNTLYEYNVNNNAPSNKSYYINDLAEFVPLSKYSDIESYTGNRYTKSEVANNCDLLRSPGKSYFKYITEDDIRQNGSKNIFFTTSDQNDIDIINNNNNYYIMMTYNDGTTKWERYSSDNEDHLGKILYKIAPHYCDAIQGFPCRLYYADLPESSADDDAFYEFKDEYFTLMGTVMFNYDKTANALGFEITPIFEKEYIEYLNSVSNIIYDSNKNITSSVNDIFKSLYSLGFDTSDEYRKNISKLNDSESIDDLFIIYSLPNSNNCYNILLDGVNIKFPFISFSEFCAIELPLHTKSETFTLSKSGEFIYSGNDIDNNILTNEFVYGSSLNNFKYTITQYRTYVHKFEQDENGLYVNDSNMTFIKLPEDNRFDYIAHSNYRLATKDELENNDIVKFSCINAYSDLVQMSSFEGSTNVSYASGTFYDLNTSMRKGYDDEEIIGTYKKILTSTLVIDDHTSKEVTNSVYIMDPTTHKFSTMISPNTINTSNPISSTEFTSMLSNLIVDDTTIDMHDTYDNLELLKTLSSSYMIKDCFSINENGPLVFIYTNNKNEPTISSIELAFDEDGNLNSGYSIDIYSNYNIDGVTRYTFGLPIQYNKITFVKTNYEDFNESLDIYVKITSNDSEYYSIISSEEAENRDDLYKLVESDPTIVYVKDFASWVTNRLIGDRNSYYNYILSDDNGSFEYRYSYIDEMSNHNMYDINEKFNGILPIKNLINWVTSMCDNYEKSKNSEKFISEFDQHFDFNYTLAYYLQMMMLAQVDNAGKNSMWDTWDGNKFYIRPYDMDTQCGLNNTGQYIIPISAEINSYLSPRTIYTGSSVSNYGIYWSIDNTHKRFSSFTTTTSRFWNIFAKVYRSDIVNMYKKLRSSGIYSYDYIMAFYKNAAKNKIGETYYNFDMNAKYVSRVDDQIVAPDSDQLSHVMGDRIDQFGDWLKQRIIFCDSYFEYDEGDSVYTSSQIRSEAVNSNTASAYPEIAISVYSPMYVKLNVGSDKNIVTYVEPGDTCVISETTTNINGSITYSNNTYNGIKYVPYIDGINKEMALYGLKNIREIGGVTNLNPSLLDMSDAIKITDFKLNNCSVLETLNCSNMTNLKTLSITNCNINKPIDLSNAINLEKLDLSGSTLIPSISLAKGCPLKSFVTNDISITSMEFNGLNDLESINIGNKISNEIDTGSNVVKSLIITDCNSLSVLNLQNYKQLEILRISNCKSLSTIYLNGLAKLTTFEISECPNIQIIDCSDSTAPYLSDFNISSIPNLKLLDITKSGPSISNSIGGVKLTVASSMELNVLRAASSNLHTINIVGESNEFGTLNFAAFRQIRKLVMTNCTSVRKITNLYLRDSEYNIKFTGCTKLSVIENSTIYKYSDDQFTSLFSKCPLTDISSLSIINTNSNSISMSNALFSSTISEDILKSVIDYTRYYEFKTTKNTSTIIKNEISNSNYNNQLYYKIAKNENNEDYYIKYRSISCPTTLKSLAEWDNFLEDDKYISVSINGTYVYTKITNIVHLNKSDVKDIPSYLQTDGMLVTLLINEYRRLYRWNNGTATEIKSMYEQYIASDIRYEIITLDDLNDKTIAIYTRTNPKNTVTSISEMCRSATPINGAINFKINSDTFDGLTKVTTADLAFYSSTIFSVSTLADSLAQINTTAIRKIGCEGNGVSCRRMFTGTGIRGLYYDFFKSYDDKNPNGVDMFKVNSAFYMFYNCSSFTGFYDEDNAYKYYTGKYNIIDADNTMVSILPSTITNMTGMFMNTLITCDQYQINGLLSGLTEVTNISMAFAYNRSSNTSKIYSIGTKVFKDLINCKKFIGTFYGCSNLNIYNGPGYKLGMIKEATEDVSPFVLFDLTKIYTATSMAALFAGCTNLTGHIYQNIFASSNGGGRSIVSIGALPNGDIDVNIESSETTVINYGAFANTSISSYDVGFIENLSNLEDISRLFYKSGTESINSNRSFILSGYYTYDTKDDNTVHSYHPGIYIDMFKNNEKITTTSMMFAGNLLLYLPKDHIDNIDEIYNSDTTESTYASIKNSYILNSDNFNISISPYSEFKGDNKLDVEGSITTSNKSIFDPLINITNCYGMFANTVVYYNPLDSRCASDTGYYKYKYLKYSDGIQINEAVLFQNNSKLTNVGGLFANSIFCTQYDNDTIDSKMLSWCKSLTSTSKMFMNNTYQQNLPDSDIFDSCRSTLKDVSYMFAGCTEISKEFVIGNNTPHVAYGNFLNNIKNDDGMKYSSKTIYGLFDEFNKSTTTASVSSNYSYIDTFDTYCNELISESDSRVKYELVMSSNEINFTGGSYKLLDESSNEVNETVVPYVDYGSEYYGNYATDNKVYYLMNDYISSINVINESTSTSFIEITGTDIEYVEASGSSGSYYRYKKSDDIGYILKTSYAAGDIPNDITFNDIDTSVTYNTKNVLIIKDLLNPDPITYLKPFKIYQLVKEADGSNALKSISSTIYRPLSIVQISDDNLNEYNVTIRSSLSLDVDNNKYYILPPIIVDFSKKVKSDLYKFKEGLLASMSSLTTAKYMFAMCRKLRGAIPEDMFYAKSENSKLSNLTDISGIFKSCSYLAINNNSDVNDYNIYNFDDKCSNDSDYSSYYLDKYFTAPNTEYIYKTDSRYYYDSECNDRYTFTTSTNNTTVVTDRYLIPTDWLAFVPKLTNISYFLQGIASLGNIDDYNIQDIKEISKGYCDSSTDIFKNANSALWLRVSNDIFSNQGRITNADYAFANASFLNMSLTETFMKNSISNNSLTSAQMMFTSTAIRSLSSTSSGTTRVFEKSSGVNTSLSNVESIFGHCKAISDISTVFSRFCNPTKFSAMKKYDNAYRETNLTTSLIEEDSVEKTYISSYKTALNNGTTSYSWTYSFCGKNDNFTSVSL